MKKFLVKDSVQAIINIICAVFVVGTLMVAFIVGSNESFLWMFATALVLTVVFLVYNNWVSTYLNRNR